MTSVLFLGGIQLIALGIIGEYIGRIYAEAKGRPAWVVERYQNVPRLHQPDDVPSLETEAGAGGR